MKGATVDEYQIASSASVDEQLEALGIRLRPCPSWCAGDHFGSRPIVLYADDGFFHYGPRTMVTDDSVGLGDGSQNVELRLELASWVPNLAAVPGPAYVHLCDGGDSVYFLMPGKARQLAAELMRLADQAEG